MGRLARLQRQWSGLWEATQVELHGHYTIEHLQEYEQYYSNTSWLRAITVCVLTPLPCLLAVMAVDLLPLEPISKGTWHSPNVWTRNFLTVFQIGICILEQFRQHIPQLELQHKLVVFIAFTSASFAVSCCFALSTVIGHPVPFTMVVGTVPWAAMIILMLYIYKRQLLRDCPGLAMDVWKYVLVFSCQIAMTIIYPIYNYFYKTLSSSQQTGFVFLLPIIKIVTKNWISRTLPDSDDAKPEAVVFNVEIFHALFVALCMGSTTSRRTVMALMAIDFVQAWLSFHDVQCILRNLGPISSKLDASRHRSGTLTAASSDGLQNLVTLSNRVITIEPFQANTGSRTRRHARGPMGGGGGPWTSLSAAGGVALEASRRILHSVRERLSYSAAATTRHVHVGESSSSTTIRPSTSINTKMNQILPTQNNTQAMDPNEERKKQTIKTKLPPRDPKRVATAIAMPSLDPLPGSVATKPVDPLEEQEQQQLPADLASLNIVERGILVRQTQKVLFVTEFIVLIEYTEVIMPMIYCIYVVAIFYLPNAAYYPFLEGVVSVHDLIPTISNVLLYSSLELVSLIVMAVIVWYKIRLSLVHQLAFVLERRAGNIQAKLLLWVLDIMQNTVVQLESAGYQPAVRILTDTLLAATVVVDGDPWSATVATAALRGRLAAALMTTSSKLPLLGLPTTQRVGHLLMALRRKLDAPWPPPQVTTTPTSTVFLLFFDGGSRGNPGPGGSGAVVVSTNGHGGNPTVVWCAATSLAAATTTNNQAEYTGLVTGLSAAHERGWSPLEVIGDSAMIIRQMAKYRSPLNATLKTFYGKARLLADLIGVRRWCHHLRQYNKMADAAANVAMDSRRSIQMLHPSDRPEWSPTMASLHYHRLS